MAAGACFGGASFTTRVFTGTGLIGSVEPMLSAWPDGLAAGGAGGAAAGKIGTETAAASFGAGRVSSGTGAGAGAAATILVAPVADASMTWPSISARMRASRWPPDEPPSTTATI